MVTHTACLLGVGETLLYVIRCRELVGSDLHDSRAGRLRNDDTKTIARGRQSIRPSASGGLVSLRGRRRAW